MLDGPDYRAIQGPTEWIRKIRNYYRKVERHVFIEIFTADDLHPAAAGGRAS